MYTLRRTEDLCEARKLHARLFPEDEWVGDDHTFWIARDARGDPVGFCSAVYRPAAGYVFLSRAAVAKSARGSGLQRRMIRTRVSWARRQGAKVALTYTLLHNHASIANLLKCGFRFYTPNTLWAGGDVHYFRLALR